jgi:hypothetical protein
MSTPRMSSPGMSTLTRPGWLTFAAWVLFAVGILRVISAISYFADSRKVNDLSLGLFGDNLWLWGLWDLVIAALALWGAWSLLNGETAGRVIGFIWAAVVMVQSFMLFTWAPWYAAASLALSLLVMYALSVSSDWTRDTTTREVM